MSGGGWVMVNASEVISFRLRCRLLRQVSGDIGIRFYDENCSVKAMQPPISPAARAYRALARLRLARFRMVFSAQKSRFLLLFYLTAPDLGPPYPGHMILGLTASAGAFSFVLHCWRVPTPAHTAHS